MSGTTYDVRIWGIDARPGRQTLYRLRWKVGRRIFAETFTTRPLADSFPSQLVTAARQGEAFDLETGLPVSMARQSSDVSFLAHAREFAALAWKE